jgi:hypothetical protein
MDPQLVPPVPEAAGAGGYSPAEDSGQGPPPAVLPVALRNDEITEDDVALLARKAEEALASGRTGQPVPPRTPMGKRPPSKP